MESKFKSFKSNEGEIEKLTEKNEELSEQILDLRCRSMKYNLIFTGICEEKHENTEKVLRNFLAEQLEIEFNIEFTSVHRFDKQYMKNSRPNSYMSKIFTVCSNALKN